MLDIKTYVRIPRKESTTEAVKIIVNVEAQKSYYPGYDIVTRAIFYCARMLSAQLGTEFSVATEDKKKYDNIKKVYSIWICMDVAQYAENTIEEYHIEKKPVVGINTGNARYDLLSVIMIRLSKDNDTAKTDDELIKMLLTLLDNDIECDEKKQRLEEEYGIPMTAQLAQEVEEMCNLSGYYEEKGIEKGIRALVETLRELGQNNDYIIMKIMEKFSVSEPEAKRFI